MRYFGDHDGQSVATLAISPDAKYVASASDTVIKVWDYKTGSQLYSFEDHQDYIITLRFDNEGAYLISGSGEFDNKECVINIWDLNNGKLRMTLTSHWRAITSLSFSPNGKYLVSGALDKTVNVWDTENGRLLAILIGHKNPITNVAITDEMQVISSSFEEPIRIWDGHTRKLLRQKDFYNPERLGIVSFVLTPDQKFVITGLEKPSFEQGGVLIIWRLSDGKTIQTLPIVQEFRGGSEELNQLTISIDSLFVLSGSRNRMVKVWMEFIEYVAFLEIMQDEEESEKRTK